MKLTTKQTIALDYLEDYSETGKTDILYGGGVGGGKTLIGTYWITKMCYKYPGSRWLIGRTVLKRLRETTLNTWFEVCRMQGVPSEEYNYNQRDEIITFNNGSQIILKDLYHYPSDPNFDSLGSLEICGAFIDEAAEISEKAYQVVKSRIRYRLDEFGIKPKVLMTCNPAKNFLYREFFLKQRKGILEPHKAFVQSLVTDNPYLPKDYIATLLTMDDASKERLLKGNWDYDEDPRVLINYEKILDMYTNEGVYDKKAPRYITADIAMFGADKFVLMVWFGWSVVEVQVYDKIDAKQILSLIRETARAYKIPESNIAYDSNGLGQYLKGFMANAKAFLNNAKPTKKHPKFREGFRNLKSQCYFHLADKINAGEVYVKNFSKEEDLNQELALVMNKSHNTDRPLEVLDKKDLHEKLGRSPDFADAMMMRSVFDVKKPKRYIVHL